MLPLPSGEHAHWSSHHSPTRCGRTGKRQLLQGYSTTKHFYTACSSANTKELLFTCQHDYPAQCFPLNADRWSYFPTWSRRKPRDVGQRRPTILPWITSCLWSLKWPVSLALSLPPPPPSYKDKRGAGVSKAERGRNPKKRGRAEC